MDALDLDARTVRVTRSLGRTADGLMFTPPKSDRSRRTVALPAATVSALREHRKAQAAERLAAGSAWSDGGLVFCTQAGTPLDPRNVSRWYSVVAGRAGVPGARALVARIARRVARRHTERVLAIGTTPLLTCGFFCRDDRI